LCPDHPVALCGTCHRTYTPEQLGTKIGDGCSLCHDCGSDLRESVVAHARTCPNLIPQKPLTRIASVAKSTTRPEVSERFETRRRARLGLNVHAAARWSQLPIRRKIQRARYASGTSRISSRREVGGAGAMTRALVMLDQNLRCLVLRDQGVLLKA